MKPKIGDRVTVEVANSDRKMHGVLVEVEPVPTLFPSRMATVELASGTRLWTADWTLTKEVQA